MKSMKIIMNKRSWIKILLFGGLCYKQICSVQKMKSFCMFWGKFGNIRKTRFHEESVLLPRRKGKLSFGKYSRYRYVNIHQNFYYGKKGMIWIFHIVGNTSSVVFVKQQPSVNVKFAWHMQDDPRRQRTALSQQDPRAQHRTSATACLIMPDKRDAMYRKLQRTSRHAPTSEQQHHHITHLVVWV